MFKIEEAKKELLEKTEAQIESETAYKWGSRAIAAYQLFQETGDVKWFLMGEEFRHEAIEHASLSGNFGELIKTICVEMDKTRPEV
jgi:hypothetical protein